MKEEEKEKRDNLDVSLQLKKPNGVLLTVSTKCATWKFMQKFLSDFESNILKDNNGK